jgi:hypothetical protein
MHDKERKGETRKGSEEMKKEERGEQQQPYYLARLE